MILITGGAGYIGSHCALNFIDRGFDNILIFDNLETGHIETIETLQKISSNVKFIKGDLKNRDEIENVFKNNKIDFVLHFAAYSIVSESEKNPYKYYLNNCFGTINLLNSMVKNNILKIVFSSTAAVYGEIKDGIADENHPKNPLNTYGTSKLIVENILKDYDRIYNLKSIIFRYFNVAGADSKTRLGEWHKEETHLIPIILNSIIKDETFKIFGNDFDTKDKSAIRDYVDVEDIAIAHFLAYNYLSENNSSEIFNLASEKGLSVFEVIDSIRKNISKDVKFEITNRRKGDPPILAADSKKAVKLLNWKAEKTFDKTIINAWKWHKKLSSNQQ